jgi:hypothetical protein
MARLLGCIFIVVMLLPIQASGANANCIPSTEPGTILVSVQRNNAHELIAYSSSLKELFRMKIGSPYFSVSPNGKWLNYVEKDKSGHYQQTLLNIDDSKVRSLGYIGKSAVSNWIDDLHYLTALQSPDDPNVTVLVLIDVVTWTSRTLDIAFTEGKYFNTRFC